MKSFNLFIAKLKLIDPIYFWLGLFLFTAIFIYRLIKKIKKERTDQTLIENGYGYKDKNDVEKIKYIKFLKWILVLKYNQGKTLLDFQKEKTILEDSFHTKIAFIKRFYLRTILIKVANYNVELKRKKNKILLGWVGDEYIYLKDKMDTSIFISGTQGYGKTILVKSIIDQFAKVYPNHNKISIITSKPEDFDHSLTFADDEKEIIEDLQKYENQRYESSKNKTEMFPTLIVFDECQNITKEMGSLVSNLIKTGRSKNIFILLATQNSNISDLKYVSVANIAVKIICRNSQSTQSAEQLFDRNTAEESYFDEVALGFGFIKTTSLRTGRRIKFYYENIRLK